MRAAALATADTAFATALAASARGPVRDGVFAVWLVVRAALAVGPDWNPTPRQRERLKLLAKRLKSVNMPTPLRRSIGAAIAGLLAPRITTAAVVLAQLAAPAAECCGPRVAEAVLAASRAARPGQRSV